MFRFLMATLLMLSSSLAWAEVSTKKYMTCAFNRSLCLREQVPKAVPTRSCAKEFDLCLLLSDDKLLKKTSVNGPGPQPIPDRIYDICSKLQGEALNACLNAAVEGARSCNGEADGSTQKTKYVPEQRQRSDNAESI